MTEIIFEGYNPVAYYSMKILPLVLMAVLAFFLVQRIFMAAVGKKRIATLLLAVAVLILLGFSFLVFRYKLPDLLLLPALILTVVIFIVQKEKTLPFRSKCMECGIKLSLFEILFVEGDVCKECITVAKGPEE